MTPFVKSLHPILLIGLGIILIRRFLQTKNIGYVVLGVAIPLWPVISWAANLLVESQLDKLSSGEEAMFPFSLRDGRTTVARIWASYLYGSRLLQTALVVLGFALLGSSNAPPPGESVRHPAGVVSE